jgi:hypothetical protein
LDNERYLPLKLANKLLQSENSIAWEARSLETSHYPKGGAMSPDDIKINAAFDRALPVLIEV